MPVIGLLFWYLRSRAAREKASLKAMEEAIAASMMEPPTLHPVIDVTTCIGCRSCVSACPEQHSHTVLGMIRGKARLVGPSNCIGHGACKTACPVGAIDLVFGTERRGVDIPQVKPNFETNVPGIFIAGELGGMGLIRNAVEQGRQAIESIQQLGGFGQHRGRPIWIRCVTRREEGGHELHHDRTRFAGGHGRSFSARQAGHDAARRVAYCRKNEIYGDHQRKASGILAGR